jgi:ribosome-associated translation inhibitor RaiA
MITEIEVAFHGIEKSEAVEQRVREKVAKLKKRFSQMTTCRVAVEVPQRTADRPKVYQVKIEMGVSRRAPVVVSHERTGSHASEDLPLAIREAFDAALRKVDGMSAKIGQRSRIERGRRRPSPPPSEPA